jgi:hypothetical protein
MTRDEIESTPWAQNFKREAPSSYEEALILATSQDVEFEVYREGETGSRLWAISVVDEGERTDFWMAATKTKKDALKLCKHMGWRVAR